MSVAGGVDELSGLEAADLREHHREQCVGGDVEGHSEEDVGRALVELAAELAAGHIELEEAVAGREPHLVDLRDIPGVDKDTAGVGMVFDKVHHVRDLVDVAAVVSVPGAPLMSVDRAEFSGLVVSPGVPDMDVLCLQGLFVGVAGEEPQQFFDDPAGEHLFSCQQGETVGEVEAHLVAEDALCSGPGAVCLDRTFVHDLFE